MDLCAVVVVLAVAMAKGVVPGMVLAVAKGVVLGMAMGKKHYFVKKNQHSAKTMISLVIMCYIVILGVCAVCTVAVEPLLTI